MSSARKVGALLSLVAFIILLLLNLTSAEQPIGGLHWGWLNFIALMCAVAGGLLLARAERIEREADERAEKEETARRTTANANQSANDPTHSRKPN